MTTNQQRHDGRAVQAPQCKCGQARSTRARVSIVCWVPDTSKFHGSSAAERGAVNAKVARSIRARGANTQHKLPAVAERSMRPVETREIVVRVDAAGPISFTGSAGSRCQSDLENRGVPDEGRGFDSFTTRQFQRIAARPAMGGLAKLRPTRRGWIGFDSRAIRQLHVPAAETGERRRIVDPEHQKRSGFKSHLAHQLRLRLRPASKR